MPDRVIRDELLTSDRWLALNNAERLAFLACLLTADTLGNMEATDGRLIRLWRDFGINAPDMVSDAIDAMQAQDLAKPYFDPDGKRHLHLPRFRQQRRYIGRLCPLSPWTTDEDKQHLTKNSRSANVVSTQSAPSEHAAHTTSAPVGLKGIGVKGIEIERGLKGGERVINPPPVATDEEVRALREADRQAKSTPKPVLNNPQGQSQTAKPNGLPPGVLADYQTNEASVVPSAKALGITWAKGTTYASIRNSINLRLGRKP